MTDYGMLSEQLISLSEEEHGILPVLSNASALLYWNLEDINWAGFISWTGDLCCSDRSRGRWRV